MNHTRLIAAALLIALALPAAAADKKTPPIIIKNDRGGQITDYVLRRQQLAASGRRVQIHGFCNSACTIFTTLPNACMVPGALIGFHQPHMTGTDVGLPMLTPLLGQYYRNGILKKWNSTWSRSTKLVRIRAEEYLRLDPQARICR